MNYKISDVMISKEEIDQMLEKLAARINEDYKGKEVLLVGVLNGAFIFLADLARHLNLECKIDFMKISSYGSSDVSDGNVKIVQDIHEEMEGKHVIIVEDIIDTGYTLNKLKPILEERNPKSLEFCVAFDKYERRKVDVPVKYCGMQIPDEFIVGYGLDYAGLKRNLPDVHYVVNTEEEG